MRVLFLTNNPIPGGTARVMLDWLRIGKLDGLKGTVALQHESHLSESLRRIDVPQLRTPMPWPGRRSGLKWLRATWNTARWAKRYKTQIVHCQEHDVYPFGRHLRRILQVPVVSHVQFRVDRGFSEWAFGGSRQPDALIWTSHQQREDCRESVEGVVSDDRQFVLPMGLDVDAFCISANERTRLRREWGIADDAIVIGAASAIRERKRIHEFLELAAEIYRRHPKVVFAFAGAAVPDETEYGERMARQLRQLERDGAMRWLGHLEPVEPFMQTIDLFISTSDYETFGMSVCEAMACRRPVIGYRGGSVHEVVGDTGLIVENGDVGGLVAATETLVLDERQRSTLSQKARQRVLDEFNPEKSLRQLCQIYDGILSSRQQLNGKNAFVSASTN